MAKGICPHCGKWFKSIEIHLGKCGNNDIQAKTMRKIQKQIKNSKPR